MAVPILDLKRIHDPLFEQMSQTLTGVLQSGQFVLGAATETFEKNLAQYCGTPHAIGVSSGTDALLMSLMALDLEPGDEVITTPFTFFATAGCIARVGAKPVFVDIDPETMNIDPVAVEAAVTPKTRAILPVHLFGLPVDMDAIGETAKRHSIHVIEDAAQAIGATFKGKHVGGFGDVGCFSFYPTKNLSACGDAGACVANNDKINATLRSIRMHGESSRYHHDRIGGNFRIDAFQSALLDVKLPHLETWTEARRSNAARYAQLLVDLPITLPQEVPDTRHVYHQYTIRVPADERDKLTAHLSEQKIGFGIFYPVPLHLQQCFAYLGQEAGSLPNAENAAKQVISLPIFPGLTDDETQQVADALRAFFK